jgi:hypothetical protein
MNKSVSVDLTKKSVHSLSFFNTFKDLALATLFHEDFKHDQAYKIQLTAFLLQVLTITDESIFDTLCQKMILSNSIVDIEENHLNVLKAYFGTVLDSNPKKKASAKQSLYHEAKDGEEGAKSMLPLHVDWFFRPLFYIWSQEERL